jgi:hypothetical protein
MLFICKCRCAVCFFSVSAIGPEIALQRIELVWRSIEWIIADNIGSIDGNDLFVYDIESCRWHGADRVGPIDCAHRNRFVQQFVGRIFAKHSWKTDQIAKIAIVQQSFEFNNPHRAVAVDCIDRAESASQSLLRTIAIFILHFKLELMQITRIKRFK